MVGETLAKSTQVFRVKVVSTSLHKGIPLNKLDIFRDLLVENGRRLTDKHNMSDLILFIQKFMQDCIEASLMLQYNKR